MFPVEGHTNLALLTDLYELTMAAGYFECGLFDSQASFELFVRKLPENRGYLVVAGLEAVVHYLETFHFTSDEIAYLQAHPVFANVGKGFFDYLESFRFTGELWAVPEGTVVFAEEPLIRVSAPLIEAQIIETFLLSMVNAQTMMASKAARIVDAAAGRSVVDFGSRRAHGPGAGVLAARATYIGGCIGTSNVYAGFKMGIPIFGTAAHAWTLAFPSEEEAFSRFHQIFPTSTTLLIDTYDVLEGARKATRIGSKLIGVRLDSGDLVEQSKAVRDILDAAGLYHAKIVASNDLNEYLIETLLAKGAKIDLFGVGTEMVTSKDAPALSGVYKLVEKEVAGRIHYVAKFSESKASWPGKKQVFRFRDDQGKWMYDVITLADDLIESAEPLLVQVMRSGKPTLPLPRLSDMRERAKNQIALLPKGVKKLRNPDRYPVKRTERLERLFALVKSQMTGK